MWKYSLAIDDKQDLDLPLDAQILTIAMQHNQQLCLWALVDPAQKQQVTRKLRMAGTGHPIVSDNFHKYIASVQLANGSLVFHFFEETEALIDIRD